MSTTLTNGLKLPDKGSVDWYADMQNNYNILDGAVGTIAEHTTALAGKAPLVHTHTKSDITDLFNSANTWSGNNTYSKTVAIERSTDTGNFLALKNTVAELGSTPASATPVTIAYRDKNDENLGYMGVYYDTDGSNYFRLYVRNKFTSGAPSTSGSADYAYFGLKLNADKSKEGILKASFRPYDNDAYDLGSSSYQWNNLYAKNYYYNGTPWGLDKANTWTGTNTFSTTLKQVNSAITKGTNPQSDIGAFNVYWGGIGVSSLTNALFTQRGYVNADGSTSYILYALENTPGGTHTSLSLNYDPNDTIKRYALMRGDFRPYYDQAFNLGIPTHRWKTLNGINPGALSLPKGGTTANVDYYNIATAIKPEGETSTNFSGTINYYQATTDGWLSLVVANCTDLSVWETTIKYGSITSGASRNRQIMVPVLANHTYEITIQGSAWLSARLMPCQGNV
jgi:hypothetical protein